MSREPAKDVAIRIAGGRILSTLPQSKAGARVISPDADILCRGFADLQINGANDAQFNDTPTVDGIAATVEGARNGGRARIMPTFITDEGTRYREPVAAVADARAKGRPGGLGVHPEGPFLAPARPGNYP